MDNSETNNIEFNTHNEDKKKNQQKKEKRKKRKKERNKQKEKNNNWEIFFKFVKKQQQNTYYELSLNTFFIFLLISLQVRLLYNRPIGPFYHAFRAS